METQEKLRRLANYLECQASELTQDLIAESQIVLAGEVLTPILRTVRWLRYAAQSIDDELAEVEDEDDEDDDE